MKCFQCLQDIQWLGLQDIVPYQTRHSGPSIDRSRGDRTAEEVRKRGRWKSHRSVQRYEKAAKLAKTWSLLPAAIRAVLVRCEADIADVVFGRPTTGLELPGAM